MDYEKAYKEALERARVCREKGFSDGESLEDIFPELKESEDERIRKELLEEIEFIIPHDDETDSEGLILPSYHARIDRYKSYLEKQKEQKPLMCDGEIEDRKRDIVAAIRKYYPADYAEYLTSFLKGLSPEDNSDDEYGQEMLGIAYKLMYEHIPENLRTQEFWDSLKFMREYTGKAAIIHPYEQQPAKQLGGTFTSYDMAKTFTEGQNYVIAHPEKFGLCKPAEWSGDDEKMLRTIISDGVRGVGLDNSQVDWLKSLRPQPHWKPSEEQMDILDKVYHYLWADRNATADMQDGLGDFIDELRTL